MPVHKAAESHREQPSSKAKPPRLEPPGKSKETPLQPAGNRYLTGLLGPGNDNPRLQAKTSIAPRRLRGGASSKRQPGTAIQRYWVVNSFGQWEDNGEGTPGWFYREGQWRKMSKAEATRANLATALRDAMEGDPGGHLGDSSTIGDLATEHASKPTHTVIDTRGLWMAVYALAGAVIADTTVLQFKQKHITAMKKTSELKGQPIASAAIQASGWVIKSGKTTAAKLKSMSLERLGVTAHLAADGSFQFSVQTIHWTPRAT